MKKHLTWLTVSIAVLAALAGVPARAGTTATATAVGPDTAEGREYTARGFGMFMHFGLATFVKKTPWNYEPENHPATEYAPTTIDTDQWVDTAVSAGAKYIVLTTKHHDGFALWDSAYTEYDVANSGNTTDVVRRLADSAHERGLPLVLYYSWYDRMQPGGDIEKRPQHTTASPAYLQYVKNQLTELLTGYGPVAGIWLDIPPKDDVQLPAIRDHIHQVSPGTALVPNVHDDASVRHADVRTYEMSQDGVPPCGNSSPAEAANYIKQTSESWGWWQFRPTDSTVTTVDQVLTTYARVRDGGATFTLNASPGPDGRISRGSVDLLAAVGRRMGPAGVRHYDDTGTGSCRPPQYSAGWTAGSWPGTFSGTRHYAKQKGATVSFSFDGTAVQVLGQRRPGHGRASFQVDGAAPVVVDTYAASAQEQAALFSSTHLQPGSHTLTITVLGEKNPAASNTYVGVDGFRVWP